MLALSRRMLTPLGMPTFVLSRHHSRKQPSRFCFRSRHLDRFGVSVLHFSPSQVYARETPPSSPCEPCQPSPQPPPPLPSPKCGISTPNTPSPSSLPSPTLARSMPPPERNLAPEEDQCATIPETQAPPEGHPGAVTRRRSRRRKNVSLSAASFASIPETQPSPETMAPTVKPPAEPVQSFPTDGGAAVRGGARQKEKVVEDTAFASTPETQQSPRRTPTSELQPPPRNFPGRGEESATRCRTEQKEMSPDTSCGTVPETQRCPTGSVPRREGRFSSSREALVQGESAVMGKVRLESSPPAGQDHDTDGTRQSRLRSSPSSARVVRVTAAEVAEAGAMSVPVRGRERDEKTASFLPAKGVELGAGTPLIAAAKSTADRPSSLTTERLESTISAAAAPATASTTTSAAVSAPPPPVIADGDVDRNADPGCERLFANETEKKTPPKTCASNGVTPVDAEWCSAAESVSRSEPSMPGDSESETVANSDGRSSPPGRFSPPKHEDAYTEPVPNGDARMAYQSTPPGGGAAAETMEAKTMAELQPRQGTSGTMPAQAALSGQDVMAQRGTLATAEGGPAEEGTVSPAQPRQHSAGGFDDGNPCRESDRAAEDVVDEPTQDDEVIKVWRGGGGKDRLLIQELIRRDIVRRKTGTKFIQMLSKLGL